MLKDALELHSGSRTKLHELFAEALVWLDVADPPKLWLDYQDPSVTSLAILPTVLAMRHQRCKMVQKSVKT